MPDDLYARDIVLWSERQAGLLRRAAAGERVNDLDWPHIVEEIEDVGGSAIRAVTSLLRRAIEHLLKLHGWPGHPAEEHWRGETRTFLRDAADAFTPGMAQRIDLDRLYRQASADAGAARFPAGGPHPWPEGNPFTLGQLLADPPDIDALLGWLRASVADKGQS